MKVCGRLNFTCILNDKVTVNQIISLPKQFLFSSVMGDVNRDVDLDYKKKSKQNSLSVDKLNILSQQELIEKILQLEAHNNQLKNLLQKKCEEEKATGKEPKAPKRKYNFERCTKRHVFLKLYYLGWDSQGFVSQDDTCNTIEYYLFGALKKCCLIENRETSNYHRCGRTDRGVSAFCQVVSIDLRSKLDNPTRDNCDCELPYATMLNRLLPDHIRCYAWAHVESGISARFDCSSRAYQYYFPKGCLDISLMQEGAKELLGEHDFRNFCKMDVGNGVIKFTRKITDIDIKPCFSDSDDSDYTMYKLVIQGSGFLWHQIRCIMAVLILIGKGKESPGIVRQLLDISENPNKPQYTMASHLPLTLFANYYENIDLKWNVDDKEIAVVVQLLQKQWAEHSIKSVMVKEMIDEISKLTQGELDVSCQTDHLLYGKEPKTYKPLLSREKCGSLEERIQHYVKRRRLVKNTENDET